MLDSEIMEKLRILQSNVIKKTRRTCSFSRIINVAASIGLKQITIEKAIKEFEKE